MAATPITQSTRYFRRGVTQIYYLPDVADPDNPTRTEMDAGTDLSPEVADISGWQVTGGEIDTPDLATVFTGSIPGSTDVEDSSITFYASQDGADVRELLPRGTSGFVMIMGGGDTADNKADVFPIRVRSVGKEYSLDDEAARAQVQFSITREPSEDVTIPSAT